MADSEKKAEMPAKAFSQIPKEDVLAFVRAAADGDIVAAEELLNKYRPQIFRVTAMTPSSGALTALGMAARFGQLEMIEFLLEKGSPIDERSKEGRTVAFHADMEAVKLLVKKGLDIDAQDNRGWTALMCEAINGDIGRVKCLLDLGASIELLNKDGRNAVSVAKGDGDFHVAKFIVKWELDKEIADFSSALKQDLRVRKPLQSRRPAS